MLERHPGEALKSLCASASRELVLVAPFVKIGSLARLLEQVDEGVSLRCVTRWRAEEIAAGVSDLEVWPLVRGRKNSVLLLRADLHAKYYRADERCLVGSANVTGAALGWSTAGNLELLVEVPASHPGLADLEKAACDAVEVTDDLYAAMLASVDVVRATAPLLQPLPELPETVGSARPVIDTWLPELRQPRLLHRVYSGLTETVIEDSRRAALRDLAVLALPPGMAEEAFNAATAAVLLQMPLIQAVDKFLSTPRRFGAVRALLQERLHARGSDIDATEAWQTSIRWLLHFLPERYGMSTPNYSEVVYRKV